jgi:hypothetical protein
MDDVWHLIKADGDDGAITWCGLTEYGQRAFGVATTELSMVNCKTCLRAANEKFQSTQDLNAAT